MCLCGILRNKSNVTQRFKPFLALVLLSAVFQIRAQMNVIQELSPPTLSTTLIAADAQAILRIGCLGGNSLFISFAVPSGGFEAGALRVSAPGREDTEWLSDGLAGRSVNIAYAARPRTLVRRLISHQGKRLVFTVFPGKRYTFEASELPHWLQALPAACR